MIRHYFVFLFALGAAAASAAVIEIVPVGSTGPFTITGNTIEIPVGGSGIEVELELRASDWADDQCGDDPPPTFAATVQAQIIFATLASGGGAPLLVKGADALSTVPQPNNIEGAYIAANTCFFSGLRGCNPGNGVSCEPTDPCVSNPDYMFYSQNPAAITAIAFNDPFGFEYLSVSQSGGTNDDSRNYFGTLILEIPADAAGTYTIELLDDDGHTFLTNQDVAPCPRTLRPAVIQIGDGGSTCTGIVSSNPPNCEVDARQPHSLNDPADLQGWESLELTFNAECDASTLGPGDFDVTTAPAGAEPVIADVTGTGNVATVTFTAPIPTNRWSCITHADSGDGACLGFLPADVDASLAANVQDITALIDSLNNVPGFVRPIWATDGNRSGEANVQDITALIDLLNGAAEYEPWNGQTIGAACPSGP